MAPRSARDELHELVDQMDELTATLVLDLAKNEMLKDPTVRPWPESLGMGHGPGDLADHRHFRVVQPRHRPTLELLPS